MLNLFGIHVTTSSQSQQHKLCLIRTYAAGGTIYALLTTTPEMTSSAVAPARDYDVMVTRSTSATPPTFLLLGSPGSTRRHRESSNMADLSPRQHGGADYRTEVSCI